MKWWTLLALGLTACNGDKDDTGETDTDTDTDTDTVDPDACESVGVDTTSCEGAIVGTFSGDESGTITGTMRDDGVLFVSFDLPDVGQINACAVLQESGAISGGQADVVIEGTYDFATCSTSGTWVATDAGVEGTWELARDGT